MARIAPRLTLHPLENYTFGTKGAARERGTAERLAGMAARSADGTRRSVEAVLLIHVHRHPHVLVLQSCATPSAFRLPGGRLRHGEGELEGMRRKLCSKLSPANAVLSAAPSLHAFDLRLEHLR